MENLDDSFDRDDRARIQAIKSQLKWKAFNYQAGERFRIQVDTIKKQHTVYFPKDIANNPTFEEYILELARAFYAESQDPIFGDMYFAPGTTKAQIDLLGPIVDVSQRWYAAAFCQANFTPVWNKMLKERYAWVEGNQANIASKYQDCLQGAFYLGQICFHNKQDANQLVSGQLGDVVKIFLDHNPKKVAMIHMASLVNSLLANFTDFNVLWNATKAGGHWEVQSKEE